MGMDYTDITSKSFMYHTEKCPNCEDRYPATMVTKNGMFIEQCRKCGTKTGEYSTEGEAIGAWNNLKTYRISAATKELYWYLKDRCEGVEAIYEDGVISLVGSYGLVVLTDAKLLVPCGGKFCGGKFYKLGELKGED